MSDERKPVEFLNDMSVPEVFTTGVSGFGLLSGNVFLAFEAPRWDHSDPPGPLTRKVVLRLVIPVEGAQAMVLGLNDFLSKQGFDPTAAATAGERPQ